ncbi:hypothetical protein PQX77_005521 [Marasmius sp. AFHP31]|nr:hypothetical protein PQX77_005521 [Marasmius sp. AFHP31]
MVFLTNALLLVLATATSIFPSLGSGKEVQDFLPPGPHINTDIRGPSIESPAHDQSICTPRGRRGTARPRLGFLKTTEGHNEDGFYYFQWTREVLGPMSFGNGPAGSFSLESHKGGIMVAGKGWNPGVNDRKINYNGFYQFNASPDSDSDSGNSSLLVYGWTRDPPVEYRIVETYDGVYNPGGEKKGTVMCNGASYDVFEGFKHNDTLLDDDVSAFQQFYSIRNPPRTFFSNGTIDRSPENLPTVDIACHFDAWRDEFNMHLGASHDIQIFAAEIEGNVDSVLVRINVVDPDFVPIEIEMDPFFDFIPEGPGAQDVLKERRAEREAYRDPQAFVDRIQWQLYM